MEIPTFEEWCATPKARALYITTTVQQLRRDAENDRKDTEYLAQEMLKAREEEIESWKVEQQRVLDAELDEAQAADAG